MAAPAKQARPRDWFVCGIPEHDLLVFTKDSDIKIKNGQQLKYHSSVTPTWTKALKQAFQQVRARVYCVTHKEGTSNLTSCPQIKAVGDIENYANILKHTAITLKNATVQSVAEEHPEWFQPNSYTFDTFFVRAFFKPG